ncbi:MAG: hypothetical protein IPI81_13635 [Flavobacteriales bacterium]|nr:hypothetical protein [Flavobacteriales bacterium]
MVCPKLVEFMVMIGEPSPKSHWKTVFGETFVLLFTKSTGCGAHTCVRPPIGIWMEALELCSIVNVPVTVQPVPISVKVIVYVATVAG